MDTADLDAAYYGLIATAEAITEANQLPAATRATIDWTLSHLALSDRVLAAAARDVLAGIPTLIDNREAMDNPTITALITSTSHAQRIDLVRRNAADLIAVLHATPDHAAHTPVQFRMLDREGHQAPEQHLPWNKLIRMRATEHLPGHTARLTAIAARR
jgi:hypothetical protein